MKDWPRDILSLLLAVAEPALRAALRATCRDLRAVPQVRGTHLVVYAGNPLSRGGAARLRRAVASENWSFLWAAVPSVIFHVAGTHAAASVAGFMSLVPLATTVRIVADHSASIYHPLDVARVVGRRVAGGDGQLLEGFGLVPVPVSGAVDLRAGRGLHAQMLRPGGALVVSRGVPVPDEASSIMLHSTAPPPSVPGGYGLSMLTSLHVHLPRRFLSDPTVNPDEPPVWLVPGSLPGLRRLCVVGGAAAAAPSPAVVALATASPGLRELEISVGLLAALWRHWPELRTLNARSPDDPLTVAALVAEAAQPSWLPRLHVLTHDAPDSWHRVTTPAWLLELIAALAESGRQVPVDVTPLVDAAEVGQGRGVRLRCVHVRVPEDTAAGAVWPHAQEVRVRFSRTVQRRDMEALARRLVGECFPAAQRWRFFGATVPMVSVLRLACPFPADLRFVELNHPDGSPLRYRQRTAAVAWGLAERCPRLAVESRRGRAPPGRVGLIVAELFRKHGVARYRL